MKQEWYGNKLSLIILRKKEATECQPSVFISYDISYVTIVSIFVGAILKAHGRVHDCRKIFLIARIWGVQSFGNILPKISLLLSIKLGLMTKAVEADSVSVLLIASKRPPTQCRGTVDWWAVNAASVKNAWVVLQIVAVVQDLWGAAMFTNITLILGDW